MKLFSPFSRPPQHNDFFEDEAELSGSEVGSEDEEEGEDDDELEYMSGDNEEVDEEELRNQVERVHQ